MCGWCRMGGPLPHGVRRPRWERESRAWCDLVNCELRRDFGNLAGNLAACAGGLSSGHSPFNVQYCE